MKFWKRIFIYSMSLFLIVFNSASIFIVESIHKRTIDRTIKVTLDEHKSVESILYLNSDSLQSTSNSAGSQLKEWLALVITGYVSVDSADPNLLEIFDDTDNILFSNSKLMLGNARSEITEVKANERLFIIRKIEDRYYLFISSAFSVQGNPLKLVLTKDISFIYGERIQNYKYFLILDGFIFLILALGMYLISKKVTRPIVILSEASKEIAQGNYSKRVKVKNKKDEVGLLAKNFNTMIEATEATIMELQNTNNAKQRFIDSLTHELKTPLTSIIGYSDLLLKSNVSDDIKFKSLNYINSEARRLEKLSFTLLKLILIKQEDIEFTPVSVKECLSTACSTVSYKLENKSIELKHNIKDTAVLGDKQLIIVLLINILDNAIKASLSSSVIEIISSTAEDGSEYILKIRDSGSGIPKEDLDKIKEPFYMVDKARDRAASGVGLGLAICDEICRVHKIDFEIDSKEGNGTEVLLRFNKETIYHEEQL